MIAEFGAAFCARGADQRHRSTRQAWAYAFSASRWESYPPGPLPAGCHCALARIGRSARVCTIELFVVVPRKRSRLEAGENVRILISEEGSEGPITEPPELSHFDASGQASMVDVSAKQPTRRTATASAFVELSAVVLAALPRIPREIRWRWRVSRGFRRRNALRS